jgi:epoxyqueuosine reductase
MAFLEKEALQGWLWQRLQGAGVRDFGVVEAGADARSAAYESLLTEAQDKHLPYLRKTAATRADASLYLPRSTVVLIAAAPYLDAGDLGLAGAGVSSYALYEDYHRILGAALLEAAVQLPRHFRGVRARPFVDRAPIGERALAAKAGLGFLGRNGCLIHPVFGSRVFLGGLVIRGALPLVQGAHAAAIPPEGCGACRRCLDACPGGALRGDGHLDPGRCISFWTIEGEGPIPPAIQGLMAGGNYVFGCDHCLAVCPWNQGRRLQETVDPRFAQPLSVWQKGALEDLVQGQVPEDHPLWTTPASRAGLEGLRRNLKACRANE